jgi:VWFA-related protein
MNMSPIQSIWRQSLVLVAAFCFLPWIAFAQQGQQPTPTPPPQDQSAPDAGGPGGDTGVIAVPKKKPADEAPAPAPAVPKLKTEEGNKTFTLNVDVPEVTVEVGVLLEKNQQFVSSLKPGNFRIYEDGVPQKVLGFKRTEAPITALMLLEFASTNYNFIYDMRNAAFSFANELRPQDYVALMTFDLHTQILTDFTQDKQKVQQAINSLRIPGFSDRNLFDALYEAIDRLDRVEGKKYIILIASGRDTFSKINLDKILAKVKSSHDITIYAISTGGALRVMTEGRGGWSAQMRDMDYLQADNEMKTFASLTQGKWFAPRFAGEMPDIFNSINQAIRSKYQIVYRPTNTKQDGTFRKIKVELVDGEGKPLQFVDNKQKPLKYEIIARDGYKAKQQVE